MTMELSARGPPALPPPGRSHCTAFDQSGLNGRKINTPRGAHSRSGAQGHACAYSCNLALRSETHSATVEAEAVMG
jgi:hypothetical protein